MNEDGARDREVYVANAPKRIKIRHIFRIFQHVHMALLLWNTEYTDYNELAVLSYYGTAVFQSKQVEGSMESKIENMHKSDMFQINSR